MAGNSIKINSDVNTVNIQPDNNKITVVNPDQTSVNITQPVTNVIQVATQGPSGPAGPAGPAGPSGSSSFETGSFVTTSSFNAFTGSYNSGSFSGSFFGDGSGLTGVTATSTQILVSQSVANTNFKLLFATTGDGNKDVLQDSGTDGTYNPWTNTLTATNFVGTATNATNVNIATNSTNTNYYVAFGFGAGNNRVTIDGGGQFTYNPSTNILTVPTVVGNLTGTATTASFANLATNASTASYVNPLHQDVFITGSLNTTGSNTFIGNQIISGSVNITGSLTSSGLIYPTVDGENGDIIQTDGAGNLSFGRTRIYAQVKNVSGGVLPKGIPVHVTSSVGNLDEVIAASASDASTMPATFVLAQQLNDEEEGLGILTGFINGVDTSGFNEGDVVYVAPNGGYTNQKPSGSNLIQNLGIVTKVDVNGSGFIYGSGRSNDVPNLLSNQIFFGSGSDQSYQIHISGALNQTIINNITASGNISSSGIVYGITGSFSHLQGNSPITVKDSITFQQPITASGDITTNGSLNVSQSITASSLVVDNFSVADTLGIGDQIFYTQGQDGFSVNEDFNVGSSTQTAYHFTSGDVNRTSVVFSLARTTQFTNMFGVTGSSTNNKFVFGSEFSNTDFEWRSGLGVTPVELQGGALLAKLDRSGSLYVSSSITGSALSINGTITATSASFTHISGTLSNIIWTVDFTDGELNTTLYAPYNLAINSVTNVYNSPTSSISSSGSPYTLGNAITTGAPIDITVSTGSVINLNITR